jgi:ATP-dependent Clp protease ATP-binding subunit ClpX
MEIIFMIDVCSFCGEKKTVVEGQSGYICLDCCKSVIDELEKNNFDVVDISSSLNPSKLKDELDKIVVGQDEAKKIISVAICNHLKRVNAKNNIVEKANILILGPTGCGKTFLMSTIASLLKIPMVMVDATNFTQVGYVGEDVNSILKKLYIASGNNLEKCQKGIVYVDEIDKIMTKSSGHSDKDVNGTGVQQNFLKLMEGGTQTLRMPTPEGGFVEIEVDTTNILFVFGGAFVGLEEQNAEKKSIGFNSVNEIKTISKEVGQKEIIKYGFIPEFIGRIPIIVSMHELTKDHLRNILMGTDKSILRQYQEIFKIDKIKASFDECLINEILDNTMEEHMGARGLRGAIEKDMMNLMFEISKKPDIREIVITRDILNNPTKALEQMGS